MKRIQLLAHSSRPREKILKSGAQALSITELLSVILVSGTKNNPVSKLANKVTKIIQKPEGVTRAALNNLGLGPSKAAQILAVLEISKRLNKDQLVTLTSAQQVFTQVAEIINQEKESLICFYLNARGEVLKKETVAVGKLNRVNLLPNEIFSLIKELPVSGIILVHNHPSGILEPSEDDVLFTKRIKAAGDILGVKLLDHLIVSPKGWKRIKI